MTVIQARGPGRVNLIGEHTDYNGGLALPFAIDRGVTVTAERRDGGNTIEARADDLGEADEFELGAAGAGEREADEFELGAAGAGEREADEFELGAAGAGEREADEFELGAAGAGGREAGEFPPGAAGEGGREAAGRGERPSGWRAFVLGTIAELERAGNPLVPCRLTIAGDLDQGSGLSSSAALEAALTLALLAVSDRPEPADRRELAKLCSRVENDWVGAETGLLDQLASLCGEPGHAIRIDFATLDIRPVPLDLGDHQLVTLDSGAAHTHADSGYNERRAECRAACERLGIATLSEAAEDALADLPATLARRARHVLSENARVDAMVEALCARDLEEAGRLLDASHASLRDDYEASVPAVEHTVDRLKAAGALGARMVGGGFGGAVLALFGSDARPPAGVRRVAPGPPAALA